MKKILACITAVALLMSFMPMAYATQTDPMPQVTYEKIGDTIKVVVLMPPVTGFLEAGVTVAFDTTVVSIEDLSSFAAGDYYNIGGTQTFVPNFQDAEGLHTGGIKPSGNEVTHAFMGVNAINKDAPVAFAEFLFTIIDTAAAKADFTVTLDFFTDDSAVVAQDNGYVINTNSVVINEETSTDPTTDTTAPTETETTQPGDSNADLAQQIKDWLESIGLGDIVSNPTIAALIDQLAQAMGGFGELDFAEIIDQIASGNFENLPLAGILQGIIDTITSLFGGGGDTTPSTTTTTTSADDSSDDDSDTQTNENGLNGDNSPGDTGIALAAAVCLAAAAAFVIVKKKD